MQSWYLEPAEILIDEMPGKEFIITNIGCILVDALSQFQAGDEDHDPKVFKGFTETHFPDFDHALPKVIPSDLVVGSIHEVDTVSEAFYSGFRCGLTVLAFGGHSTDTEGLYEIWFDPETPSRHCYDRETGEKYPFVLLNPVELIELIKDVLESYLSRLRDPGETELRENFVQKIE